MYAFLSADALMFHPLRKQRGVFLKHLQCSLYAVSSISANMKHTKLQDTKGYSFGISAFVVQTLIRLHGRCTTRVRNLTIAEYEFLSRAFGEINVPRRLLINIITIHGSNCIFLHHNVINI